MRVLLQSLAVEHMQFTINVQILKFLNTNFSLYSSINESHSGNTSRRSATNKWKSGTNCSRQPSRLQNLAAHAYNFFFRVRNKKTSKQCFVYVLKPKLHVITAPGGMVFDDSYAQAAEHGFQITSLSCDCL
jgi:hypothetical protein